MREFPDVEPVISFVNNVVTVDHCKCTCTLMFSLLYGCI